VKQVTIIQRILPHYRVPFFAALHERLRDDAINLQVIFGQELPGSTPTSIPVEASWAKAVHNRYWLGGRAVWQPCSKLLRRTDLVIVEHANGALLNYALLLRRFLGTDKLLAFWGHGRNVQRTGGAGEVVKSWMAKHADWWFTYTDSGVSDVAATGFPEERITVVHNSIDTAALSRACASVTELEKTTLRESLGLRGNNVCLYCGGMYANKKLDFLIEACVRIRKRVPDFEMLFVGHGPEQYKVAQAAVVHDWIRYVGPRFGSELAAYYSLGKLLLIPGLVGLAILDSFVAGTPLITTDIPIHSPEISYLHDGVNGCVTSYDIEQFSAKVVGLLESNDSLNVLRAGCALAAQRYTIEQMQTMFAQGVRRCLR